MQHADDPPRLLDDPDATSGELRLGLERFSRDLPSPERLTRLAAALGVDPNPPAPSPAPGKAVAAKVAVGAGVVGIAAVALFLATRDPSTEAGGAASFPKLHVSSATASASIGSAPQRPGVRPQAKSVSAEDALRSGSAPAAVPSEPAGDAGTGASRDVEPSAAKAASKNERGLSSAGSALAEAPRGGPSASRSPASGSASASPTSAPQPSETELLRDARLVLERDPNQALALSEQHRRVYPSGGFSQERELIAVTALVKLGRMAEARSRADRFRQSYPQSAYRERLDHLVSP